MKVAVIVTGGTIAATRNNAEAGLYAPRCGTELMAVTARLGADHGYSVTIERWQDAQGGELPLVDSCEVNGEHWLLLAAQIDRLLRDHTGVVVLHGTDTLAYTAAALAMLEPQRTGNVVITGAQIPLAEPGTDAIDNLQLALDTAAGQYGQFAGDTLVAFGGRLLRGVAASKHSTRSFAGFRSWRCPEFLCNASADGVAEVNRCWQRSRPSRTPPSAGLQGFVSGLLHIRVVPGMAIERLKPWLLSLAASGGIDGLVVELFGAGSAPCASELAELANALSEQQIPVLAISACPDGAIDWQRYEATAPLRASRLIDGGALTPECAVVKLMGVLHETRNIHSIRDRMQESIAGEGVVVDVSPAMHSDPPAIGAVRASHSSSDAP